ncbi:unnamed protein product [Rhizophagus irregularis]|uniref:Uncharacterized protein n=1 Tax=Rhizophagus irregularis TaxID=588596 RepID=A0A2N1NEB7_9GLOM|nr:hypothetical protein RhiirC2_848576 [Rhizophagus irregularis]CAB4399927.1 unnamed protein product [Rhizophagus irregularis]CAB5392909.1 unnamed protein product [Rhizophagus irregularis]
MALTKINECCCCIPLKSGVVIITLLWLIYGAYATVENAIYISVYRRRYIAVTILYGFVTLGATFGLYVLTFANTSKMLREYSIIAFFIAAVEIMKNLATIIIISLYKQTFSLKKCANNNYDYYGGCNILIVIAVISILLSAYFPIVVLAYTKRRKSKENAAAATDDHPYGQTMTSVP